MRKFMSTVKDNMKERKMQWAEKSQSTVFKSVNSGKDFDAEVE